MVVLGIIFSTIGSLYAVSLEEVMGSYRIQSYDNPISYVHYNGIYQKSYEYYYMDSFGKEQPVYCLNMGVPGAEAFCDGYEVIANEAIKDNKIASIVAHSYPYQSLEELGLETVNEARFASQFAIWTYLNQLNLDLLYPAEGKYQRVVDAIKNIYNSGVNQIFEMNGPVRIYEKKSAVTLDENDSNYYSKWYYISSNTNVKSIQLQSSDLEVKLVNEENEEIKNLKEVSSFKVLIPSYLITSDKHIKLNFKIEQKVNVSLMGISPIPNTQNVAITLAPFCNLEESLELDIRKRDTKIEIKKVDKEDPSIVIPGVKFRISYENGEKIGEYITDENGLITLDVLSDLHMKQEENLIIEEIEVPPPYEINPNDCVRKLKIQFGKVHQVCFENEKIKGRIKIKKSSLKDNPLSGIKANMPLEGTVFEIYNKDGEVVDRIVTNHEGIAISKSLVKGIYQVREVQAREFYQLDSKSIELEIKYQGEEILVSIANDNIELPKRLPKTGF